jgi:hypothetical protein
MCIPCVPGVRPEWFDLGLRHGILGSCLRQYDPLNRPCCGLDTHFFASCDDDDCLAPPHWRSPVTTCRQGTSGLFQDAARRPSLLRIDTLCLEGIYPQKLMRFSQLIFGPKNIPLVEYNIVSFGLNSSSLMGKDGQMSIIEGPLYSPKKCKCDSCSLALPHEGHRNYRINR